jgi:hypothetical protein
MGYNMFQWKECLIALDAQGKVEEVGFHDQVGLLFFSKN